MEISQGHKPEAFRYAYEKDAVIASGDVLFDNYDDYVSYVGGYPRT
jgi:hypothetical protein